MKNHNSTPQNHSRMNSAWMPALALAASLILLAGALSAQAQLTQIKNSIAPSSGTPLSSGSLWVSGTAPGTGDIAEWTSAATATGDSFTSMDGAFSVGEIKISGSPTAPVGAVSITDATAADTLTLNGATSTGVGVDMSAATVNLTLGVPLVLGGNQTWNIANGRTLTLSGVNAPQWGANTLTINGPVGGTATASYNYSSDLTTGSTSSAGAALVLNNLTFNNLVQLTTATANTANTLFGANTSVTVSGVFWNGGEAAAIGHQYQIFTGLTLNPGTSYFNIAARQSSSSYCVGFSTITRNAGSMADFIAASGSTAFGTGNNINSYALAGSTVLGYATVGENGFLLANGPTANIGQATYTAAPATAWAAANNVNVTANDTEAAGVSANTVRFNTAGAVTATLSGLNTIVTGAILVGASVGANPVLITGGTLTSGNTTADGFHDLIVINNNTSASGSLTINSVIADNPAPFSVGLTVGSSSNITTTTTLGNANTFSGTTFITRGSLKLTNSLALQNSTFNTSLAGSLVLTSSALNGAVTLAGLSGTGNLALPANFALTLGNNNASSAFSGALSGTGATVTKTGTGTLTFNAANTYTGLTTVSQGTLAFGASGLRRWINFTRFRGNPGRLGGGGRLFVGL